jgi:hypothetical protein
LQELLSLARALTRCHRSATPRYFLPCRDAIVRRLHDSYFPAEMPASGCSTILSSLPRRHRSAPARDFLPCRDAIVRLLHETYFPAEPPIVGTCTILYSLPNSLARTHHPTGVAELSIEHTSLCRY